MTIFCKRVHAICLRVKLHMPNFQGPLITGMKTQAITDVTVSICTALLVEGSRGRSPVPGDFFPGHQTVPCALVSTQPLNMSTRIFLGVKTAGA